MAPGSTTMPAGPAAAAPAAPVPGPLATGGAGGMGATSNPRFTQVDRPNMSAAGGFGRGGAPQMTALNLAGLFGGGQPAAAANMPTRAAQPVSGRVAGPLAAGATGNAPWGYGPQQRNVGWPSRTPYGPDWRDLAASRSGYQ
jgi:hypothetical protein